MACCLQVLALLLLLPPLVQPETALTDAELLLAFKRSFKNGEEVLTSWSGVEPCGGQWLGITCTAGLVTSM